MTEKRFPILTTERLNLRCVSENDAQSFIILRSDVEVNKYIDRPKTTTIEAAKSIIQKILRGFHEKSDYYWVTTLKGDELLIGTICLWQFSEDGKSAEIGYELLPSFQGKGIMHEAILSVIDFGFNHLGLTKITAIAKEKNLKSIKLLEKIGFREDKNYENEAQEDLDGYIVFALKL